MDSKTTFVGLFGFPIGHSLSPIMHNTAFEALGLNYAYGAFAIPEGSLKHAVEGIRALGFRGANVTIPYKVEVMDHLDDIDEEALEIGAVNTIVNDNGKLVGYNTDGRGYVQSLTEEWGTSLEGKRILVLGAGGAARGVCVSLARRGVGEIVVANRSRPKAEELAHRLKQWVEAQGIAITEIDTNKPLEADLVINTTSVGMSPHVSEIPIPEQCLHEGLMVSDLIYNPFYTRFLNKGKERGAKIHNGLGMFVHQGAIAFELWTGKSAPTKLMREAVLSQLKQS